MTKVILILAFIPTLLAADWQRFELCRRGGPPEDALLLEGHRIKGHAWLRTEQIVQIMPLSDVENCVMVVLATGKQAYIVGSEREIWCRVNQCLPEEP